MIVRYSILIVFMLLPTAFTHAQSMVRTAKAQEQTLQQRQQVTGSLRAVARGDIAALEAGRLIELTVREGDLVAKGEVIARVDARRLQVQKSELQAEVLVAEAELARMQATSRLAATDLRRSQRLIDRDAVSRQELDQHQAAVDVARADIEAAKRKIDRIKQSVELLEVRLTDTQIEAPYDASVVARHVEPGDWVAAGDPLLTLVSTGPIQAWLEVPERFASEVSRFGKSIVIHSPSTNQTYASLSTKRVADVNPRVRTLSFIATIPNPDNILAPGMSVSAWIASGENRPYLTVPKDAVIRHSRDAFVFGVSHEAEKNVAKRYTVQVLFETPTVVAIKSGTIHAGDEVIVEGNERLMPEQAVVVVQDQEMETKVATR